ncbi:halocyanin domain protein [Salinarchaeum sp. Harcht-Bsk1]|uniref:halocyanin domain-containing protein n=1 Tax=Salinarchaeum sp. Harcht-Bsk1 TaxID=1333523 RepID=UPI0003422941|nr:halocyanin domain-containing protein [Salinarchaeum sp. Harcht-Bsk1]AGN02749.1 halocyanin domain protein [Salinarchaeum sp. Harcht-Bsk1]
MEHPSRRRFLYGSALAIGVGVSGCVGGDDDGNDTEEDGGADATDGGMEDGEDGDGANMTDGDEETDGGGETDDGDETDGGNETTDGDDETDGDGETGGAPSIEDYPVVEEWLTETELGGADDSWDGTLADETGTDTVTVAVGADGNGGSFAYGPSAVAISVGTTVEWDWTGEGNPHNVEALPAEQLGESDFEFSSGEATGGSGVQYTRAFEETGVALYHCEPHFSLGMKGAIVVVE